MNISPVISIWSPAALVALAAIRALMQKMTLPGIDPECMPFFLRRVDLRLLEDLLDPAVEAQLRKDLSSRAFRRVQSRRILAACEQIRRLSNNASVFLQWANKEFADIAHKRRTQFDASDALIVTVIKMASDVKNNAWWALLKLRFWRLGLLHLWPFLPSPSLSDVREVYGRDILHGYENLVSSAGELLLACSSDYYDKVRAAL